jgi:hypothetical protein
MAISTPRGVKPAVHNIARGQLWKSRDSRENRTVRVDAVDQNFVWIVRVDANMGPNQVNCAQGKRTRVKRANFPKQFRHIC